MTIISSHHRRAGEAERAAQAHAAVFEAVAAADAVDIRFDGVAAGDEGHAQVQTADGGAQQQVGLEQRRVDEHEKQPAHGAQRADGPQDVLAHADLVGDEAVDRL
jgi:hypothetical protein